MCIRDRPSAGQTPHGIKQNRHEILDVNKKKYQKLLWGTGFVIIVLILTLFVMSQTYIPNLSLIHI